MKYWQFFPAPDAGLGLPTGVGLCHGCRVAGRRRGRRATASGATFRPARTWSCNPRASATRASSTAPRTAGTGRGLQPVRLLPTPTPPGRHDAEGLQAVLRPLFTTSFLIDDFLADNAFFGARQLLLSSASSKTAYGTAFCLAQRRGTPGAPAVVGLTSAGNLDFTRSLGCYDAVRLYGDAGRCSTAQVPTVYIDFAGNARCAAPCTSTSAPRSSTAVRSAARTGTNSAPAAACPGRARCCSSRRRRSSSAAPRRPRAGAAMPCSSAWVPRGQRSCDRVSRADDPLAAHRRRKRGAPALQAAYAICWMAARTPRVGLMLTLQS